MWLRSVRKFFSQDEPPKDAPVSIDKAATQSSEADELAEASAVTTASRSGDAAGAGEVDGKIGHPTVGSGAMDEASSPGYLRQEKAVEPQLMPVPPGDSDRGGPEPGAEPERAGGIAPRAQDAAKIDASPGAGHPDPTATAKSGTTLRQAPLPQEPAVGDQPSDTSAGTTAPLATAQEAEGQPIAHQAPVSVEAPAVAPDATAEGGHTAPDSAQARSTSVEATITAGESAASAVDEQPSVESPAKAEAPVRPLAALEAGTVVAGRYTISGVVEDFERTDDMLAYRASDSQSYQKCWSCGSKENGPATRFCQNCGAPVQDHPVTLVETRQPTHAADEVAQDEVYFHVQPPRRMFGVEGIGVEIGAHSAEGPHHPNEDSYWYVTRTICGNSKRQTTAVIVFADGMGGYAPGSGLISAQIAETTGSSIVHSLDARSDTTEGLEAAEAEAIVREAIAAANEPVLAEIASKGEMGSTLVAVMIMGDQAYVANIGDSRAYYVDPHGTAAPVTRDQSLVAQEIIQGHLNATDIYTALGNNIILHAIGEQGVEDAADFYVQPLEPGSILLICSDGYWKTMHGAVVPDDARAANGTLSDMARRMVDDALAQGSDDNTTVMLIGIS